MASLYPSEAALVARASGERRRQFAAGRACARSALAQLGVSGRAIGAAAGGSPQWPRGIAGSISHTNAIAVAAAAPASLYPGLGIDAERIGAVGDSLWPLIFTPGERAMLGTLANDLAVEAATALFSAKEALFKCVFPLLNRWIDFLDVEIRSGPGGLAVEAAGAILQPLAPESVTLQAWTSQGHVVTLACLEPAARRAGKAGLGLT